MDGYRAHIEYHHSLQAMQFFVVFSRYEFALKRGGFLKGSPGKRAEPDWDSFAEKLGSIFFDAMRAAPEADIFFSAQPKRLIVVDAKTVDFVKPANIVNGKMLFEAIRLVRNNLFHGEKPCLRARDKKLLTASLFVLDSAMQSCPTTKGCELVPPTFDYAHIGEY